MALIRFRRRHFRLPVGTIRVAVWLAVAAASAGASATRARTAEVDAEARDAEAADESAGDETDGIFLPTDRLRQRQLDRARRLIDDARWSDAATLLDEILGADRDFFFRPDQRQSTWQSIKTETARVIGSLAPPGREAYELQFRARADGLLRQAVAADDAAGVVAVARRWFHTPAGHRATLLAAVEALECNQPLAAAAWLDRLAATEGGEAFEPTLSIMRAIAWFRAGDRRAAAAILDKARTGRRITTRIGGKDVTLSFPEGGAIAWLTALAGEPSPLAGRKTSEWWLHRGDAARNAVVSASRPLLVPRYRVPLTRHPEESRLLEKRRRLFADQETPLFPAGTPLAVDGSILAHTPMGLLAIDFETGKRTWLQTAGASAPPGLEAVDDAGDGTDAEGRRFVEGTLEDATSGTLASDGRLVFVVESDPDAVTSSNGPGPQNVFRPGQSASGWKGGNTLAAYDVTARGAVRWRLPGRDDGGDEGRSTAGRPWYMGAPLPIGDQLFVLVEEKAEIRLDVLDAATGRLEWSQPLAELDEDQSIDNRDSLSRRVAGLSPSLAEGVLVCPTGAGAVVAVDLATRTLLWAYHYPRPREGDVVMLPNGIRVRRAIGGLGGGVIVNGQWIDGNQGTGAAGRWRDAAPILAAGRVILTPHESDELHCLDLRRGTVAWKAPRKDRLHVAGVFDGRVIVVGQRSVESLSLESGRSEWPRPPAFEQGSPSGRGMLAEGRLFVPLDTPEVVEIDLVGGRIVDRSPARGGNVPGNLVAYRGEMISQGIDSLDVFHQTDPLENRVETALRAAPEDPAALVWRGQLDLDRGRVGAGIDAIRRAHAAEPGRIARDVVDSAIAFGMRRDFATAARLWREAVAGGLASDSTRATLRVVVDGFLKSGDLSQAWEAWCSAAPARSSTAGVPPEPVTLLDDSSDPRLTLTESRWLQGRLADLFERADPTLRAAIDAFAEQALVEAVTATDPVERISGLESFIERFGRHPAALRARESLAGEFDRLLEANGSRSDAARDLAVRRDVLRLSLTGGTGRSGARGPSVTDLGAAWPVGRVVPQRAAAGPRRDQNQQETLRLARMMWIPVEGADKTPEPGLRLGYDMQQPGFVATDGLGRRIGEPFGFDGGGRADGTVPLFNPMAMGTEASAIGNVVVVRAGPVVAAFELAGRPGEKNRRLWLLSEKSNAVARTAAVAMGFGRVGRAGRARIPLGMRISEPEEVGVAGAAVQGGAVRATGLPVSVNRSIELHDPVTGGILWERHRLPAIGELFGDDQYLCACPSDGRGAVVLSMADGRLLRTCDMPRREQRLLTSGRRIVTVRPQPGQASLPLAGRVRLDLFDPVTLEEKTLLEECHGGGFAEPIGTDRLAIVEPTGRLTVFDLDSGRTVFRTTLNEMPDSLNQLRVIPWEDRYLVFCGREENADEQRQLAKVGMIAHLPQGMAGREPQQPATGSLWAVDRDSGDLLWPVPATILRHCLHGNQPSELPLLLFVRQIQPSRGGDRPRLSVLCLDKRTGHAAHVDDRITVQPHMLFGCDMAGDPQTHTITLTRAGGDQPDLRLEFTGEPMAPRPPHQAAGRPPVTSDLLSELEYWLQRALTIPLPF